MINSSLIIRCILLALLIHSHHFVNSIDPKCLPASQRNDPNPSSPTVHFDVNNWTSSELNVRIVMILLNEKIGVNVAANIANPSDNANFPDISAGTIHANLEVWSSGHIANYNKYVTQKATVNFAGNLGVVGQIGWFIPTYMLQINPDLKTWQGFRSAASAKLFAGTRQDGKGQFLAGAPTWTQYDQQIMDNLGIPLVVEYQGGDNLLNMIDTRYNNKEPVVFYWWQPHQIFKKYDLTRVQLPQYTDACYAKRPTKGVDCDYPPDILYKITSSILKTVSPDSDYLIRQFQYTTATQEGLLAEVAYVNNDPFRTACNWITANFDTWKQFLPQPTCELGSFFNSTLGATGKCQACAPGSFTETKDAKVCSLCPAGTFGSKSNLKACQLCPVGAFKAEIGSTTSCTSCLPGTFADNSGSKSCSLCQDGQYSTDSASVKCLRCPLNTYQELKSSISCNLCPLNTFTPFMEAGRRTDCTCNVGFYSPTGLPGTPCNSCLVGGTCLGGVAAPYPLSGYFAPKNITNAFYSCVPSAACLGGINNSCRIGHIGAMCTQCLEGYYRVSGLCHACVGTGATGGSILFLSVVFIFILCFVMMKVAAGNPSFNSITISVNFLQVMAIYVQISLPWPESLLRFFDGSTIINFNVDLMQTECSKPNPNAYHDNYFLHLSMPLIIFGNYVFIYGLFCFHQILLKKFGGETLMKMWLPRHLPKSYGRAIFVDLHDLDLTRKRIKGGFLAFLIFCYIFLSAKALEAFDCTDQGNGVLLLDANPQIVCYEGAHLTILPLSVASLLLYTVGIPLFVAITLYRNRFRLSDPVFLMQFGFLYRKYTYFDIPIQNINDCTNESNVTDINSKTTGDNDDKSNTAKNISLPLETIKDQSPMTVNNQVLIYSSPLSLNTTADLAALPRERKIGLIYLDLSRRRNYYYWELCIMARKLGFNISRFFTKFAIINGTMGQMVLLTALLAEVYARPYVNKQNDSLEMALLLVLYLLLYGGSLLGASSLPDGGYDAIQIILVILICIAAVLIAYYVYQDVKRKICSLIMDRTENKGNCNEDYELTKSNSSSTDSGKSIHEFDLSVSEKGAIGKQENDVAPVIPLSHRENKSSYYNKESDLGSKGFGDVDFASQVDEFRQKVINNSFQEKAEMKSSDKNNERTFRVSSDDYEISAIQNPTESSEYSSTSRRKLKQLNNGGIEQNLERDVRSRRSRGILKEDSKNIRSETMIPGAALDVGDDRDEYYSGMIYVSKKNNGNNSDST